VYKSHWWHEFGQIEHHGQSEGEPQGSEGESYKVTVEKHREHGRQQQVSLEEEYHDPWEDCQYHTEELEAGEWVSVGSSQLGLSSSTFWENPRGIWRVFFCNRNANQTWILMGVKELPSHRKIHECLLLESVLRTCGPRGLLKLQLKRITDQEGELHSPDRKSHTLVLCFLKSSAFSYDLQKWFSRTTDNFVLFQTFVGVWYDRGNGWWCVWDNSRLVQ